MTECWFDYKTVILSGASSGIGKGIATRLIKEHGCKVIGIARNEEKLLRAIDSLGEKKDNFSYQLFDVSIKENWENFRDYLQNNNIIPDILINNAGFMLPFLKFNDYTDEQIEEIISTDFKSVVYATKTLYPLLKKSKTPAIINISSVAGKCAVVGQSMYCATKFAVKGFTETLQQEYGKEFYVCGIYPGFIRTNILHKMSSKDQKNKLIDFVMKPLDKAVNKMASGIKRKKHAISMGIDGKTISVLVKIFPKTTPKLVTYFFKKSGLELFKDKSDSSFNKEKSI